jgi:uncharacterized protein
MLHRTDLAVEKVKASNDGLMEFVASTNIVDRAGDIVEQNFDLKHFRKNPVFLWGHNGAGLPIGKIVKIWSQPREKAGDKDKDKRETRIQVRFVPPEIYAFAETVRQMYEEGFLKAVSIGFRPLERAVVTPEERDALGMGPWGERFTKSELYEVSAVSIPANPEALAASVSKGFIGNGGDVAIKLAALKAVEPASLDAVERAIAAMEATLDAVSEGVEPPVEPRIYDLNPEFVKAFQGALKTLEQSIGQMADRIVDAIESLQDETAVDIATLLGEEKSDQPQDNNENLEEPEPGELDIEDLLNEMTSLREEIQA